MVLQNKCYSNHSFKFEDFEKRIPNMLDEDEVKNQERKAKLMFIVPNEK